jgi:hypothetical protein
MIDDPRDELGFGAGLTLAAVASGVMFFCGQVLGARTVTGLEQQRLEQAVAECKGGVAFIMAQTGEQGCFRGSLRALKRISSAEVDP